MPVLLPFRGEARWERQTPLTLPRAPHRALLGMPSFVIPPAWKQPGDKGVFSNSRVQVETGLPALSNLQLLRVLLSDLW